MKSGQYDQLMIQCLGYSYLKKGTVYYGDDYLQSLRLHLQEDGLLEAYKNELSEVTKNDPLGRIKMCSIASSSRLCYLASKTIILEIDEHEKTDVKNGCCAPHFDAYSSETFTFYEFKCHEFCQESHDVLVNSYKPLLESLFNISCEDTTELRFLDFGVEMPNNPLINKIRFDFKQFICHIIGLLSIASKTRKPTLQYVWVIPDVPLNEDLQKFVADMKSQIDSIFFQIGNLKTNTGKEEGLLKEFISFELRTVPATSIPDFVLADL